MNTIFIAVFSLTTIGIICAAVLVVSSKLMYVKIDERVALLTDSLPGVNCGACGYPGCSGYAVAIANDDAKPNLCSPGGADTLKKISAILGVEAGTIEKKIAVIHCRGDLKAQQKKHEYRGIKTCEAAKRLYAGEGACAFGCMGYGDCKLVCPTHAVCLENGLATINTSLCTGCGLCVKVCPKNLISLEKADIKVAVLCTSIEKGAVVRKKCSNGCIGCSKCVRECPDAAIIMENNLAKIDYAKCTNCGHCAEICVTGSIRKHSTGATC